MKNNLGLLISVGHLSPRNGCQRRSTGYAMSLANTFPGEPWDITTHTKQSEFEWSTRDAGKKEVLLVNVISFLREVNMRVLLED